MIFELAGEVVKKGIYRKSQKPFIHLLVVDISGEKSVVPILTKSSTNGYEVGKQAKVRVETYINIIQEAA